MTTFDRMLVARSSCFHHFLSSFSSRFSFFSSRRPLSSGRPHPPHEVAPFLKIHSKLAQIDADQRRFCSTTPYLCCDPSAACFSFYFIGQCVCVCSDHLGPRVCVCVCVCVWRRTFLDTGWFPLDAPFGVNIITDTLVLLIFGADHSDAARIIIAAVN